jgi:hypothetical protein
VGEEAATRPTGAEPFVSAEQDSSVEPARARRAEAAHSERRARFVAEMTQREAQSGRLSLARLIAFVATGALVATALAESSQLAWILAALSAAAFVLAVIAHQRVHVLLEAARTRRDVHERNLARISGRWVELTPRADEPLPRSHPYAWDVDLVGPGSLLQRIDVTHTVHGERTLLHWLGQPADAAEIAERQAAVLELAELVDLRQELEAAALRAADGGKHSGKLDGAPFLEFASLPSYFAAHRALVPVIFALPLITLTLFALGRFELLPRGAWLLPLAVQVVLLMRTGAAARRAFDLVAARQGAVAAFEHLLRVIERASLHSPKLRALQQRLLVGEVPPSVQMKRLAGWASAAELRQQFLFYIVVCPVTLWDLHVLRGLESWNERVGKRTADWFAAIGELEALCALATLTFCDGAARMPHVSDQPGPLSALDLQHPLLPAEVRVGNDVSLPGPGSALVVTGSNMAGKSTLLRALGLNAALALAGGPVCAREFRLPRVRLRASMRAEDSLQRGASYFHAELQKLRMVIEEAEQPPPVLFLLDELLRGTNQRARQIGARAVLLHLLKRSALGLVATHDVGLSALEGEHPGRIGNVHFTDVVIDGEMRFDYRLRPGVVRTSNALRLLGMAGVDVPEDDGRMVDPELEAATAVPAGEDTDGARAEKA